MPIKVTLRGTNVALLGLKSARKQIRQRVMTEIEVTGKEIESAAKRRSPVNFGVLRAGNYSRFYEKGVKVGNNVLYAPFVEFGTKSKVKIPKGSTYGSTWERIAKMYKGYKGNGGLSGMFQSLTLWVKRKGIDAEAEQVMYAILKNGIAPQPFFVPSVEEALPKLQERINKIQNETYNV